MHEACQGNKMSPPNYRTRCWYDCQRRSWLRDWTGWKMCGRHFWQRLRSHEVRQSGAWFYLRTTRIFWK